MTDYLTVCAPLYLTLPATATQIPNLNASDDGELRKSLGIQYIHFVMGHFTLVLRVPRVLRDVVLNSMLNPCIIHPTSR